MIQVNGVVREFHVKVFAIFLSLIYPFIMIYNIGILDSLSQYWTTEFQPLFIISNIICSYFFFSLKNWKIPSFFLMLLTSFSWADYQLFHNIFAVCFYFSCLYCLFKINRYKFFRILYIISILAYPYSILLGEIITILILSSFHLKILLYKEKLEKRNTLNKKTNT